MGLITTSPSPDNIISGGSRMLIKFGTDPEYYHFGRIKNLQSTPNLSKRDTFNAMDGSPKRAKHRVNMTSMTHKFDAIEAANRIVRAWLMGGSESAVTQASASGQTETIGDITGASVGANVVVGAYYLLAKRLTSAAAWAGKVEGTDFKVEPKTGAIAFLRAVIDGELAESITYDCAAINGTQFSKFANLNQAISARIINTYEDGAHHDEETIPQAKLEPSGSFGSGDDGSEQGKDAEFQFTIEQEFHDTLGWGTFARLAV